MVWDQDWEPLLEAAREAREGAHAPFSGYHVGAALLAEDGRIFRGANVEFGIPALGVCAERAAVIAALTAGAEGFQALVVVTESSPPASPCGLCRQTLAEVVDPEHDLPILIANSSGERQEVRLSELLPRPFRFRAGPAPSVSS